MKKRYKFAIIGATGLVGNKFLEVLQEYKLPISELKLFASKKSAGKKLKFDNKTYKVHELTIDSIKEFAPDFVLMSAGASVSKEFAPIIAKNGGIVIDNSSCWRLDKTVPLIVPEVNFESIKKHKNIIANPNCSTIQAVVALNPLHKKYKIKRIIYTTFQAVSGAGVKACEDLKNGINGLQPTEFSQPIFDNLIPKIDSFLDNGYTKEEEKMINETKKILDDQDIKITATCIRVPLVSCHSESINVEFENAIDRIDDIKAILENSSGIKLLDDTKNNIYPTPLQAKNTDLTYVGRIRIDYSQKNTINMWVVADNLRKGAASNAIQIAKKIIETY